MPGPVRSGLLRYWPGLFGKMLRLLARLVFRSPKAGAQSILWAIGVNDLTPYQGKVIYDCQEWAGLEGWKHDYKQAEGLWSRCQGLCEQHVSQPKPSPAK